MMIIPALIVFWASAFLVVYVWFGYPMLLWLLTRVVGCGKDGVFRAKLEWPPSVSVIIAVHNEEAALPAKLENCLALRYPRERLQIVVASDGSTDGTRAVAAGFATSHPNVRLWARSDQRGKTVAQNGAVQVSSGDIVVFSDVDTTFHAGFLEAITRPFADDHVGCVTGRVVWTTAGGSAIAGGSDAYWRYEHWMWRLESRLGLLAWGSGACLAVRRSLFTPVEAQYGEDCVVPLDVVSRGYRVVFLPDATASEAPIVRASGGVRARTRMTLRSFTGTLSRKHLLNPLRFPGMAWAIMSHKLLRWSTPYFLLLLLASNVLLLGVTALYRLTLGGQILFYLSGTAGYILDGYRIRVPLISTVYAFCVMNLGVTVGVAQALLGRRIVAYRSEG